MRFYWSELVEYCTDQWRHGHMLVRIIYYEIGFFGGIFKVLIMNLFVSRYEVKWFELLEKEDNSVFIGIL